MDIKRIGYMVNIVSTMEDKDIIDFIEEYDGELTVKATSSLIANINDNAILINYVKNVSNNIDTVLSKWNDLPDNYVGIGGKSYLSVNDDNLMDQLDSVIADFDESDVADLFDDYNNYSLYKETYENVTVANELISNLMTVIGKIKTDYEKCNLLNLWFKKIEPNIISYLGQKNFDIGCKEFYLENLYQLLGEVHDIGVLSLLTNNNEYLSEDEVKLLFDSLESDLLKYSLVDDYDFVDNSMIDSQELSQDDLENKVLDMLEQIDFDWRVNDSSSSNETLNSYILKILDDITKICCDIEEDDIIEEIFEEVYEKYGILCMPFVAAIHDDDKKISLFDKYNIAKYEGYVDVLASIQDDAKFKELYDKMDDGFVYDFDGFKDDDRLELILARGDKLLAYKMLFAKYDEFKARTMADDNHELINQVCNLISVLDENEQVEIYNWFAEIALQEEKEILIIPVKNIELKRQFLKEMQEHEKEEVSSYVKSKKLYN